MKLGTSKKDKSLIAVYAVALVIYILTFAIVPFPKNSGAAWIAFVFTVLAFAVSYFMTKEAFFDDTPIVSKVYGYPIFRIGIIYLAVQVIFSIIILSVGFFTKVPYWTVLLPSVVFLGLAAVGFIATDNARDIIQKSDSDIKEAVKSAELFKADMAGITDLCENPDIKKKLEILEDAFRYSDPVSSEATKNLEISISGGIAELRDMIASSNNDIITAKIKDINNLLNERNRICKMNKQ